MLMLLLWTLHALFLESNTTPLPAWQLTFGQLQF
jgi:hypothetical protein